MKIYPWHIANIPGELYQRSSLGGYGNEGATITEKRLKALLRLNQNEGKEDQHFVTKEHRKAYLDTCGLLKVEPMLRMRWETYTTRKVNWSPPEVARKTKEVRDYYTNAGWTKSQVSAEIKKFLTKIKNQRQQEREAGSQEQFKIGAANFDKMQNSIQNIIHKAISNCLYNGIPGRKKTFEVSEAGDKIEITVESLTRLVNSNRGPNRAELEQYVNRSKGFYADRLNAVCRSRLLEPPRTIFIAREITGTQNDQYENCYMQEGTGGRYQKFKPRKMPEGINEGDLYIDPRGTLAQGEEIVFSNQEQAWIEAPPGDRWLCSNDRANPALLNYHAQPKETDREFKARYRARYHQIGFEVEFDTPYNKGSCIRNKENRPLTPIRVFDDYGWALSPDASVGGGELKSPVIYFKHSDTVDQILDQIPQEIQEFINMVNKGESCGGHLNYSTPIMHLMPVTQAIMTWGFVFPMMYPKRVDGHNKYTTFKQIQDPTYKYQWLRLKKNCVEVRVFPAHWDIGNIMWRSKLVALMVEDAIEYHKQECKKARERGEDNPCTAASAEYFEHRIVARQATANWSRFLNEKSNPIKQHIISQIGNTGIQKGIENPLFPSLVHRALGIPTSDLTPA